MKIVLSGYFGFGNIGDEAILEAIILGFREKMPAAEITVLSAEPRKTAEIYNVKAVNRFSYRQIRGAIASSDILISGGGGLIQDSTGQFTIPYYLGIIHLAKRLGKTTVVFGQGFGPVRGWIGKLLSRWVLNKVDLIIVRDEKSADDIISLGVKKPPIHVAGDVTAIIPLLSESFADAILGSEGIEKVGKPLIGISIRHPSKRLSKERSQVYYQTIAAFADHIIEKHNARLVFIPFHYPTDIIESSKIVNLMSNPVNIIMREYAPVEILAIISQMDIMIGMRLHSLIFSAMAGVPMLGISYDPKVRTFVEMVEQKWVTVEEIQIDLLVNAFEHLWTHRDEEKNKLAHWAKDLKTKAEANFEILFSFLGTLRTRDILGIKFDNVSVAEAKELIEGFIKSGKPNLVVTPNPEIILSCRKNENLRNIINNASLRLPDGVGVIWASRVLGKPLKERVTGIDMALELMALCEERGYRIFLLGSKPGIAEGAAEFLERKFPKIRIAGTYHGYFTPQEEPKVIENIRSLKPDIVFLGLGSPKQETWAAENLDLLEAPVVMAIGGSLDVISGRVKRAPGILRRLGLEWLYRLLKEPWRWSRQAVLIKFVFLVLFTRLFPEKKRKF